MHNYLLSICNKKGQFWYQSVLNPAIHLSEERRKRQVTFEESNSDDIYACVKVVIGYTAYRSCVPKYGDIRVNCTSMIGRNVVCYCHTDECNVATFSTVLKPWILILSLLYVTLM